MSLKYNPNTSELSTLTPTSTNTTIDYLISQIDQLYQTNHIQKQSTYRLYQTLLRVASKTNRNKKATKSILNKALLGKAAKDVSRGNID